MPLLLRLARQQWEAWMADRKALKVQEAFARAAFSQAEAERLARGRYEVRAWKEQLLEQLSPEEPKVRAIQVHTLPADPPHLDQIPHHERTYHGSRTVSQTKYTEKEVPYSYSPSRYKAQDEIAFARQTIHAAQEDLQIVMRQLLLLQKLQKDPDLLGLNELLLACQRSVRRCEGRIAIVLRQTHLLLVNEQSPQTPKELPSAQKSSDTYLDYDKEDWLQMRSQKQAE